MFDNVDIIITSSTNKKELLQQFSNSLKNIKIYTLSEFNKLFYYDYDVNANLYIMNKYDVIYISNISEYVFHDEPTFEKYMNNTGNNKHNKMII